jgi:shikimate kinase
VVALGGGAVTYPPTRELVAAVATRVFIDVPPTTIYRRVQRTHTIRPMLGGRPDLGRIERLHAERLPLYLEAEIAVCGNRRRSAAVVREIIARLAEIPAAAVAVAR